MKQVKSPSFEFYEPQQIGKANVLEQLLSLTHTSKSGGETWACAWAPDNSFFAWSSGHRILNLIPWDITKRKRQDPSDDSGLKARKYHIIDCAETIWSLAFGSGGVHTGPVFKQNRFSEHLIIATGLASGRIKIWNCFTGTLIVELLDHRDTVRCLDFSKDGQLQLISAAKDGTLKLWDMNNEGNMYHTFKSHSKILYGCKFSPNGKFVAAVGSSKAVYFWTTPLPESQATRLEGHCNDVVSLDFSPDSSLLATSSYDTKVFLWDCYTLKKLRVLGHLYPSPRLIFAGGANDHYVRHVNFSRCGQILASVCDDGFVRFWDLTNHGDPIAIADVSDGLCCQFSTDGTSLAVGCRTGNVEFLASPLTVPSLLHMSRMVVRNLTSTNQVDCLPLPSLLKHFLKYRDYWQDDSVMLPTAQPS